MKGIKKAVELSNPKRNVNKLKKTIRIRNFAAMHRSFANILLLLHLFSAVVPAQVKDVFAKLPDLAGHYQKHLAEDPQTGMVEFLAMHYGEAFTQHRSDHDHHNLPGKDDPHHHTGVCACASFALPIPAPFLALALALPESDLHATFFQEQNLRLSSHLSSIWQPPKQRTA